MPDRIKTLFIGNRPAILRSLYKNKDIELTQVLATDSSLINQNYFTGDISLVISSGEKHKIVNAIINGDYKLLVSAGCPYIIPVEKCQSEAICINSHPSVLPFGRGKHPINECILSRRNVAGSTLHYLSKNLDGGEE